MGFVTVSVKRLNVLDFHVLPRNGRWMSTTQDCMHFIDTIHGKKFESKPRSTAIFS
jgi:hypothetical protein